jgi:hypothetical protein
LLIEKDGKQHVLFILPGGVITGLHTDDLAIIGHKQVRRASDVEFDNETQLWKGVIREEFRTEGHNHIFYAKTRAGVLEWERYYFEDCYEPRNWI